MLGFITIVKDYLEKQLGIEVIKNWFSHTIWPGYLALFWVLSILLPYCHFTMWKWIKTYFLYRKHNLYENLVTLYLDHPCAESAHMLESIDQFDDQQFDLQTIRQDIKSKEDKPNFSCYFAAYIIQVYIIVNVYKGITSMNNYFLGGIQRFYIFRSGYKILLFLIKRKIMSQTPVYEENASDCLEYFKNTCSNIIERLHEKEISVFTQQIIARLQPNQMMEWLASMFSRDLKQDEVAILLLFATRPDSSKEKKEAEALKILSVIDEKLANYLTRDK